MRGVVVALGAVCALLSPVTGLAVVLVGWHLRSLVERWGAGRVGRQLAEDVLLATELSAVSVSTGTSVPETIDTVTPHLPVSLRPAFSDAMVAYRNGAMIDDELVGVVERVGDPIAPLIAILRAAHIDGDPVLPALTRLADQLRAEHRRTLEADVRRLSVRLLVPLVCCSLPGFVLIAVVPLVVGGVAH